MNLIVQTMYSEPCTRIMTMVYELLMQTVIRVYGTLCKYDCTFGNSQCIYCLYTKCVEGLLAGHGTQCFD